MKFMTLLLASVAAGALGCNVAVAADVYSGGMKDTQPPVTVTYSEPERYWAGAYAGLYGGYTSGDFKVQEIHETFEFDSGIFGAQLGYDFQGPSQMVFGVVGDIGWLNGEATKHHGKDVLLDKPFEKASLKLELTQLATLRGRVGVVVQPDLLVYATGGAAFGWTEAKGRVVFDVADVRTASADETHIGYTVGGGAEYKFSEHWSAGAEYQYVDLGDEAYRFVEGDSGVADLDLHMFTVRINRRF